MLSLQPRSCPGYAHEPDLSCPKPFWTHRLVDGRFRCDEHGLAPLKRSVVLFVVQDGRVLGVSRKDDLTDWGLPGGKVEISDGSDWNSITREVFEETGLLILDPVPVYSVPCHFRSCTAFTARFPSVVPLDYTFTSDEGTAEWRLPEDFTALSCSFSDYNINLFRALGVL